MRMKGSQILFESLLREGVDIMWGLPGGAILPVYDTLPEYPQIKHVLVRHEQAAAFAADGYARATGKVGVCIATSGPGATNLVTGIAGAYMDSVPVVAITGQVPTAVIGRDAFQECDITGITLPVTKHNYLVTRAEDIADIVKEAFHLARTGRPGPVLIDLPKDIQTQEASFHYPESVSIRGYRPTVQGHPAQIKKATKLIAEAKRPLIIAGHGVLIANASEELRELAEKAQVPVTTTLLGLSCFPEDHVLSFGLIGLHGVAYANLAIAECDLLIGVGMRFDDRVTGKLSEFAPNAQVIHIDIDPAEHGKNVRAMVPIVGDVKQVLSVLNKGIAQQSRPDWISSLDELRREHPSLQIRDTDQLLPQYIIRKLSDVTEGCATIVADIGQHQMWAAQHYWYTRPHSWITSGGLGAMGYAFPAALGAKQGAPDQEVWCITGDGGFQMTLCDLATAVEHQVAVKIAIINNGSLGMVRQIQDLQYAKRYVASAIPAPDFVKLADAYGVPAMRVTSKDQVEGAFKWARETDGPVLIDFIVSPEENVYPMIIPGYSTAHMIEEQPKQVRVGGRR